MVLRTIQIRNFILLLALSSGIAMCATILIFEDIVYTWVLLVDLVVAIIWIIGGILAYGLQKNFFKLYLAELQHPGYDQKLEKWCVDIGMGGLFNLVFLFIDNTRGKQFPLSRWRKRYPLGLCFKMPQELCRQ